MSDSLFARTLSRPLAERLRPERIEDVVGQDHLLGPGGPIRMMLDRGRLGSMLLYGPSGSGKTTLAQILARQSGCAFSVVSAVTAGIADLRRVVDEAHKLRTGGGRDTVVFVDEFHRLNAAQQDYLLPWVEDGTIILIGATTDNPAATIRPALRSRAPIYALHRLDTDALEGVLLRAESSLGHSLPLQGEAREALLAMADGDGRYLLNMVQALADLPTSNDIDVDAMTRIVSSHTGSGGVDAHYVLLSALQKSIRGSDVQASLYYLARLLRTGEPARALFRRLLVMATEEIGLADPGAIQHTLACADAYERMGEPEGLPVLAQCVGYLATAIKSNAIHQAFGAAMALVESTGSPPVPSHLMPSGSGSRSDPAGVAYVYDHDCPHAFSGQEYMPVGLAGSQRPLLYQPSHREYEAVIARRMDWWLRHKGTDGASS